MSGRFAYRPRYRHMYQNTYHTDNARHRFLSTRWTYRQQRLNYEKRPLGYSLSLLPLNTRFLRTVLGR